MAENVLGLVPLLISRSYNIILNLRKTVLKNKSTVSMSARGIAPKLIKAPLISSCTPARLKLIVAAASI